MSKPIGMTLRDYFAANAPLESLKIESMEGLSKLTGLPEPKTDEELLIAAMTLAAKASYIYADAMLKAKES